MSPQQLAGKSFIVTGAGQGLGRAYALEVARQGGSVAINDRDPGLLAALATEVTELGARAEAVIGSVADWSVVEKLVSTCAEAFGSVDALVNNAGVLHNPLPWGAVASMVYGRALETAGTGVRFDGVMPMAVTGMTNSATNGSNRRRSTCP